MLLWMMLAAPKVLLQMALVAPMTLSSHSRGDLWGEIWQTLDRVSTGTRQIRLSHLQKLAD